MKTALVRNLAAEYQKIKRRGYVMVKRFDNTWVRKVTKDAGKIFLARFDESIQKRIRLAAGEGRPSFHVDFNDGTITF